MSHPLDAALSASRLPGFSAGLSSLSICARFPLNSAGGRKAKSVTRLPHRASHLDMFDMKPDARAESRRFRYRDGRAGNEAPNICAPRAEADKYATARRSRNTNPWRRDADGAATTRRVFDRPPRATIGRAAVGTDYCGRADGVPSGVNLPTFLMEICVWPGNTLASSVRARS